jgi:hypothetical protein
MTEKHPEPAANGRHELAAAAGESVLEEVAVHEIGESAASAVIAIQRELSRYPEALGSYVIDEFELSVPVRLRMDGFGQMLATVVNGSEPSDAAAKEVGNLRLRMRPADEHERIQRELSGRPLAALDALSPAAIARLERHRIFTVEDLQRVARTPVGREGIAGLSLGVKVDELLKRAFVVSLPVLPGPVAEALVKMDMVQPRDFIKARPENLAPSLSRRVHRRVTPEEIVSWQKDVSLLVNGLPLPRRPGAAPAVTTNGHER